MDKHDAYLTVTVHYITDDWEMLSSFSIATCTSKVVTFVHDSGSNIKLAGQLLQDKYGSFTEPCTKHNLQLNVCVNDGLRVRMIEKAIAAACQLVGHFQRSELTAVMYVRSISN